MPRRKTFVDAPGQLELSSPTQLDLAAASKLIVQALKRNADFWLSSGLDLPRIIAQVEKANSIEAVWQVIVPLLTAGPSR